MTDEQYVQLAIQIAREGIAAGQSPFGAVVVRDGQTLAVSHNTVWRDSDPTAHAEVNAIRQAAAALHSIDLNGCTMFTTCEPCPMCLAAIHWSKINRVAYGATIADAAAAGFSELHVPAEYLAEAGRSPLRVEAGPLREQCRELFELWRNSGSSRAY
ncbi:MAG: nucleoside deaminase [Planctomycetes bacterium]|nr:nucleoside deaminase [Planctomycetota bacterium]